MSKVDIWTLRSLLLIEQCFGPSSRCDHTVFRNSYVWNDRELATLLTLNDIFGCGWIQAIDHRIDVQESCH